jgi:UDP-N-acetylmuramoyl-tripeptide--D-alanyl-D-alanine ligase
VGTAHLEHFGSVEAIAREKAELGRALPPDGVLYVGADSPALIQAVNSLPGRRVTYGLSPAADLRAESIEDLGPRGTRFGVRGFPTVRLALVGIHQVTSALGALAVAREHRLDPAAAVEALEGYRPQKGRMELRRARGAELLVDCYNANPDSARAALETLASWPARRRIAVLGDMLELGERAAELHREVAGTVRGAELWVVGEHAGDYAAGGRAAGAPVRLFPDKASLAGELHRALEPGTVVLLKASRGAALEQVLEGLERED